MYVHLALKCIVVGGVTCTRVHTTCTCMVKSEENNTTFGAPKKIFEK